MFAVLGNITFSTLTSPDSFRLTSEYHYAEHKVVEARPRLQWLAQELATIALDISMHVAFVNPATQMNRLRAAAEDHQARALVFGNGVHRGYFIIESLEEEHQQLADDGSYVAISARLQLREWVPGAEFDPTSPPKSVNPPPGIVKQSPLSVVSRTTTSSGTGATLPSTEPKPFNLRQGIGPHNLLTTQQILQMSLVGAGPGVTYAPVPYQQPGISAVTSTGAAVSPPGNPTGVPTATITRAG